jgi:hypothetical protein
VRESGTKTGVANTLFLLLSAIRFGIVQANVPDSTRTCSASRRLQPGFAVVAGMHDDAALHSKPLQSKLMLLEAMRNKLSVSCTLDVPVATSHVLFVITNRSKTHQARVQ